jgi:signal transduction histidine kinase
MLSVTSGDGRLEARIEDDGRGGSMELTGSGHGLVGMRERVVALGGSLEAGPCPDGGFRVRIVLPLPGDSE